MTDSLKSLGLFDDTEESNDAGNLGLFSEQKRFPALRPSTPPPLPKKEVEAPRIPILDKILGWSLDLGEVSGVLEEGKVNISQKKPMTEASKLSTSFLPPGELSPERKERFYSRAENIEKLKSDILDQVSSMKSLDVASKFDKPFSKTAEGVAELQQFMENYGDAQSMFDVGASKTLKLLSFLGIPNNLFKNTLKRLANNQNDPEQILQGLINGMKRTEMTTYRNLTDEALKEMSEAGYISDSAYKGIINHPIYKILTFGGDLFTDLLLFVGSGERAIGLGINAVTRTGKASRLSSAARFADIEIKLDSKAADFIAEAYGASKPASRELIGLVPEFGTTAKEQADLGQRALLTWFGRPVYRGKSVYKAVDAMAGKLGKVEAIKNLRKLVSTKTGNAQIDALVARTRALYNLAWDEGMELGQDLAKRLSGQEIAQINQVAKIIDEGLDYEVVKSLQEAEILGKNPKILKPGVKFAVPSDKDDLIGGLDTISPLKARRVENVVSFRLSKNASVWTKDDLMEEISKSANIEATLKDTKSLTKWMEEKGVDAVDLGEGSMKIINKDKMVKISNPFQPKIGVLPEIDEAIKKSKDAYEQMRDIEQQRGLLKDIIEYYFPRVATREAKTKALADVSESFNILPRGYKLPYSKGRTTGELTLEEANEALTKEYGLEQFFTNDPAVAAAVRRVGHGRALARDDFFRDITRLFEVKEGNRMFSSAIGVEGIEELAGKKFAPEIASYIKNAHTTLTNPEALGQFERYAATVTDFWKAYTLGVFPAYHSRNLISNIWNNFLAGVTDPLLYVKAMRIQAGGDGTITTMFGKMSYDEIRKLGKRWGIEGTGLFGMEIPEAAKRTQGAQSLFSKAGEVSTSVLRATLPTKQNVLLKTGFAVGKGFENNARYALFIDSLAKGMSPGEAALKVARYLFDYSDLTRFEKHAKIVFPFMKWTKQNVPLQVSELFRQPGKYSIVNQVRQQVEGEPDPELMSGMPEYLAANVPMRIKKYENGDHAYWAFGGYWPGADLEKILSPLYEMIKGNAKKGVTEALSIPVDLLNPGYKIPLYFPGSYLDRISPRGASETDRDLDRPTNFLGTTMQKRWAELLKNVRLFAEIDRMQKEQEMKGGNLDQRNLDDVKQQAWLRFLTGLKLFRVSPAKQKYFQQMKQEGKLQDVLYGLKRLAEEPPRK